MESGVFGFDITAVCGQTKQLLLFNEEVILCVNVKKKQIWEYIVIEFENFGICLNLCVQHQPKALGYSCSIYMLV